MLAVNFSSESCMKEPITSKLIMPKLICNSVSNSWTINWLLLWRRLFFFKSLAKKCFLLSYNLSKLTLNQLC